MSLSPKEKLWNAWCVESSKELAFGPATALLGFSVAGGACRARVPRLPTPGHMTLGYALKLLPTLQSFSVSAINKAMEDAARGNPMEDALDMQMLIALIRARDFLLAQRDLVAQTLAKGGSAPVEIPAAKGGNAQVISLLDRAKAAR